jgi:hypothetical protein
MEYPLISVKCGCRGSGGSRAVCLAVKRVLVIALAVLGLVGSLACGGGPRTQPHTLSSGKTIRVLSVGQMHFSQSEPALVLSYQTDLKIDQAESLRSEVIEIWKDFRKDVDGANLASAIIMANEVPKGRIIQQGRSFNFLFEKRADGTWPDEPRSSPK